MFHLVVRSINVRSCVHLKDLVTFLQTKHLILPSRTLVLSAFVIIAESPMRLENELVWPQGFSHICTVLVVLRHVRDSGLK